MAPRLDIIEARLDSMAERQEDTIRLLQQVLVAQEAEVEDRRARRGQLLHLLESTGGGVVTIARAALVPGVILPLSVVAVLALALLAGASITYGDLMVQVAEHAMDTDQVEP